MKKAICLLVAASLCLAFLVSCRETETKHEISDYDSVSRITAEENDVSGNRTDEVSQAPAEGEIVVKDKKYVFEGTDLVILEVDNKTNRDYSITINGTYLDENGKTLKTETQTFDQYSAGYKNYFLFRPGINFDKFSYTVELNKASSTLFAKDIEFEFQGLSEFRSVISERIPLGDYKQYPGIMSQYAYKYSGNERVLINLDWILFNEKGEIIFINYRGDWLNPGQDFDTYDNHWLYHPATDVLEWPEGWKGNITAITAVHRVATTFPDQNAVPEESTPSKESAPTTERNDGREPIIAVYEDKPRNITVEIYDENTKELVKSFEITDRKECNDLYFNFNKCFADACNEYPAHNVTGDDKNYKAEYRVLVRFTTYADEEKTEIALCAEVCYPYGYTNEIYSIVHFDVFGEYAINNGKNFIDPINEYVKKELEELK